MLRTDVQAMAALQPRVDAVFARMTPETPGCAAAAARNGRVLVDAAYGVADLERGAPITTDSVFDIGSTHKQFVAASVLLLVADGRLKLSDDIRTYMPELPDYGHVVTVDHLLTHTSGMRDWTALLPMSAANEDALTAIKRQRGLNFRPGDEFSYSNSGYVLAKEIVARASGMPFGDFVEARIFRPLGMTSTRYSVDMRGDMTDRALGYERQGERWELSMRLDEDRGGGGVLSSTGDLITWNEALTHNRLGALVTEMLQAPARLNNGRVLGYGRGLFIEADGGDVVYRHGGGSAGYQAMLARLPKPGVSIAVLCNSGEGTDQGAFARELLDLLAPEYAEKAREGGPPAKIEGVETAGRAGVFVSEAGDILRLEARDGRVRVAGGPILETLAVDRFRNPRGQLMFMSQDEFALRFVSADLVELITMEGAVTLYARARHTPTAEELQALAGKYASDELDTTFDVGVEDGKLAVRLAHIPDRVPQFAPVARDLYQFGQMTLRFERDASGSVVALAYSNPMLRNVRMVRVG